MKALKFSFWLVIAIMHQHAWLQNRSYKIERAESSTFSFIESVLEKLSQFSPSQKLEFQNCLSLFIQKGGKSSKLPAKIIQWVCRLGTNNRYHFSNSFQKSDCIRFLLDAKVDPNAVDEWGNTPLFILTNERPAIDIKCIEIMLDAGAHIDLALEKGYNARFSALRILKSRLNENYSEIFPLINSVRPLNCLCANVIRKNKIPFGKLIPSRPTLESFVRRHSQKNPNMCASIPHFFTLLSFCDSGETQ